MYYIKVLTTLYLCLMVSCAALKVSAWNLQRFGKTKMGKTDVVSGIVKVTIKSDLMIYQEVQDVNLVVPGQLLQAVNAAATPLGYTYNMATSERVGRTSYKEQYVLFFRSDKLQLNSNYTWDSEADIFKMDAYTAYLQTLDTTPFPFGVICLHAHIDEVISETDALVDVYDLLVTNTGVQDALILGDLNADCDYLSTSEQSQSRLFTDTRFRELIGDDVDTTTKSTHCAYDRIFAAGTNMKGSIIAGTAKAYRFDNDITVMNPAETPDLLTDISDHYPVEVEIDRNLVQYDFDVGLSSTVAATTDSVATFKTNCQATTQTGDCGTNPNVAISTGTLLMVEFVSASKSASDSLLDLLTEKHPVIVPSRVTSVLKTVGGGTVFNVGAVNGGVTFTNVYKTVIFCNGVDCHVSLDAKTTYSTSAKYYYSAYFS